MKTNGSALTISRYQKSTGRAKGILVLLFISQALSGTAQAASEAPDNPIFGGTYHQIYEICKPSKIPIQPEMARFYLDGLKGILSPFSEHPVRFSTEIQTLLSSTEYWDALEDCYGMSEWRWQQFTVRLIVAERAGRITGALLPLGLFNYLRQTRWFLMHPGVIAFAGKASVPMVGVPIGAILLKEYLVRRKVRALKKNPEEGIKVALDERADSLYQETLEMLDGELTEVSNRLKSLPRNSSEYAEARTEYASKRKSREEILALWRARKSETRRD